MGRDGRLINHEKERKKEEIVKILVKERKNQRRGRISHVPPKEKQEEEITRLLTRKHQQSRQASTMTEEALGADHLATWLTSGGCDAKRGTLAVS